MKLYYYVGSVFSFVLNHSHFLLQPLSCPPLTQQTDKHTIKQPKKENCKTSLILRWWSSRSLPTSTLIISQIAEVWAWTHLPTTLDAQELYMRRCRHAAIKYLVPHMMYSREKETGYRYRKTRKSIILWGKVIFKTVIFMTYLPWLCIV